MLQAVDEPVHVLAGIEAQSVHASVELDVYGIVGDALLLGCLDEGLEQTERIDLGLEVVVEHGLEGGHLGVHHHDVGGDAVLAQGDTLVGDSHSQIVYAVVLQGLGYLDRP